MKKIYIYIYKLKNENVIYPFIIYILLHLALT